MNASDFSVTTFKTNGYRGAHAPLSDGNRRDDAAIAPRAVRQARITRSQELKTRISAALVRSGYAALKWVACEVQGDQVILQGSVPSYHLKQLAQVYAQRVDGVERIQNCLEVSRRLPA